MELTTELIEKYKSDYERNISNINNTLKKYSIEDLTKLSKKATSVYGQFLQAKNQEYIDQILQQINYEQLNKFKEKININLEQAIPENISQALEKMIKYGWYPDLDCFSVNGLIRFSEETNESIKHEIDDFFIEHYRKKLKEIKDKIFDMFPNRKDILQATFDEHEKENYLFAIPIFLIHIDGISVDIFKKHFFMKKRSTNFPEVKEAIENMNFLSEFSLALLTPFQSEQPIIYSEKQRGENFNYLNRHQIMHGESLDYGTEINSYKVISLLLYIVQASEIIEGE